MLFLALALVPGAGLTGSAAASERHLWKVVWSRNDGGLSAWTSEGRRALTLTGRGVSDGLAVWSPDGEFIAFARSSGRPGVYVQSAARGKPRRILATRAYSAAALAWSPDSRTIAVAMDCETDISTTPERCVKGTTGITALYAVERNGSHVRRILAIPRRSGPAPEIRYSTWSPDGRHIAYVLNGTLLYTVGASGGRPHLVAAARNDYALGAPAWSPDSRTIAYGGRCYEPPITGDIRCDLIVRASSGRNPRVLLRSFQRRNTGVFPPTWTPDSRSLLYSQYGETGRPALFVITVSSGRHRVVLRRFADVMAVARDGAAFAFIEDSTLPRPSVATLSGRLLDRAPRIPLYTDLGTSASLWIR
jgi:Tol biopolymer transport system component